MTLLKELFAFDVSKVQLSFSFSVSDSIDLFMTDEGDVTKFKSCCDPSDEDVLKCDDFFDKSNGIQVSWENEE